MVFSYNEVYALKEKRLDANYISLDIGVNPIKLILAIRKLYKKIRIYKPNIIHAHFGTITSLVCALLKRNLSFIITFRGSDLNPSPFDGFFRDKFQKLLSHISKYFANSIVCVSKQLQKRISGNSFYKCQIITTGVDKTKFQKVNKTDSYRYTGFNPDHKNVIFVGDSNKVSPGKRLYLAEESFTLIKEKIKNARFHIVNNIPHDKMVYYYTSADLLLFTSAFEGSPCVIQEAATCNLPIVTVNVGDVKEILDNYSAFKIVDDDPQKIAAASIELMKQRFELNTFELIDQRKQIDKIIKVYENLGYK